MVLFKIKKFNFVLLNFEYTYITLFGFKLFEPVTILTNGLISVYGLFAFLRTNSYSHVISKYWGMFFLLMGVSTLTASVTHGVHEQLGDVFLRISWFLTNAVSFISIYYFYRAAFTYFNLEKENTAKIFDYIVIVWIATLLLVTLALNDFLLVKIHAGIVLVYSLIVHSITYRNKRAGSGYIVIGILISFFSILVHSLKLSFGEWFNYKDISHLIMLTSLVFLNTGVKRKMGQPELLVTAN